MSPPKEAVLRHWIGEAARTVAPELAELEVELELPRHPAHGDLASNCALKAAGRVGLGARELAQRIVAALPPLPELVERVTVEGPGFINLHWSRICLAEELATILAAGDQYGRWAGDQRERIQIEFVSANPTGPLNVVSARAAAVGDSLARLFEAAGYRVETEFYVNDAGSQVAGLGQSVRALFEERVWGTPRPAELPYQGSYVGDIAGELVLLAESMSRVPWPARELVPIAEKMEKTEKGAPAAGGAAGRGGALASYLRSRPEEAGHRALAHFAVCQYGRPEAGPGTEPPGPGELAHLLAPFVEETHPGSHPGSLPSEIRAREVSEIFRDELDFASFAVASNLEGQRQDLDRFGVHFNARTGRGPVGWFRESWLHREGAVARIEGEYEAGGFLRAQDGARWLVTSRWGDTEDRVVRRSSGEGTYFLSDLAYHLDKRARGYDRVIDIWGPDHHGHVARMQAGLRMLGCPPEWLTVLLAQQVNLLRDGQPVKMSKRAGEFVTLGELMDEVGREVARFLFLMRRTSSPLDFDLGVALRESEENPIYYIEYAYARLRSIFQVAAERGVSADSVPGPPAFDAFRESEELDLLKRLARYPAVVDSCVRALDPQGMGLYLRELAQAFHRFYHRCRVLVDEDRTRTARLALARAVHVVLGNGLRTIGVEPPEERM